MGFKPIREILSELFESKCPECGNVDRLMRRETETTVHCQRCYHHYEYKEAE